MNHNCNCEWNNDGVVYCPLHRSAPQLLEALKDAIAISDGPEPEWQAIVDKAEGQS